MSLSAPIEATGLVTVAAIQLVSGADVATNLASAARGLAQAAANGARLAVLPEAFALFAGGDQRELGRREAGAEAAVRPFLAEQAARHGLWIVGGTLPLLEAGQSRPHAACLVFDAQGFEVCRYDKIHLFDVEVEDGQRSYRESDTYCPGHAVAGTVDTPFGCLGLAVCYDLRFPELFGLLRAQGAQIIAVPSAFTRRTGLAHWLPLLRARAIETQCTVIGANQGGVHTSQRQTSGGSAIISSWGDVLAEAPFGEACLIAELDLGKTRSERAAMPVASHRRFTVAPRV
jgi:predicted amidohydrolase